MNDIVYAAYQPSDSVISPSQPDRWHIFYCTEGEGTYSTSQLNFPYAPGTVLIVPPDFSLSHRCRGNAKGILLHLHQPALTCHQPDQILDDENQSILHLMQDALWHLNTHSSVSESLLSAYGQLLVQHISLRRPTTHRSQLVQDLAQNIMQNYANPNYSLESLLKAAPYCQDYLCRLFRHEMGTTPHKYLTELRLHAAADALRAGWDSSIAEIAHKCGYSDALYFSRLFKQHYGLSPREYAKQK